MPIHSAKKQILAEPVDVPELTGDLSTSDMRYLIRRLLHKAGEERSRAISAPADAGRNEEAEQILLDLEVDGVRCVLIRVAPRAEQAVALSPRELEIARMIAKGYSNKVIAAVLDISSWTVCTHIRRIFAKLGVGSRAAMVARLLECGWLGEERVPGGLAFFADQD